MERSRSGGSRSLWPFVMVFGALAVITVAAGYFGGQYLLRGVIGQEPDPYTDDGPDKDVTSMEMVELTGQTMEFYRVQVGAFSDQENALAKQQALQEQGIPAAALPVEGEGLTRVVVGVTDSREAGEELAAHLESEGLKVAVMQWEVPSLSVQVEVRPEISPQIQSLLSTSETLLQSKSAQLPQLRPVGEEAAGNLNQLTGVIEEDWQGTSEYAQELPGELVEYAEEFLLPYVKEVNEDPSSQRTQQAYFRLIWATIGMRRALCYGT